MSLSVLLGLAVFLASVILSQKISVNAAAELDDATKLKIIEVFPKRNLNYTILVFGMVIAFLAAMYLFPQFFLIITVIYAAAFTIYIFVKLALNVKKLREIAAPPSYIGKVIISFSVFIGGAVAALIVIAVANFGFGD
jgi:hypothetical protein